jgi:hypothetical protein
MENPAALFPGLDTVRHFSSRDLRCTKVCSRGLNDY